ncbi:MAG: AAA family ATPase [Acidobacteria bacterium]|nr:AAA family ATPase [Acidobacteriota bacterium]
MRTTREQIQTALASAYPLVFVVGAEEERLQGLLETFARGARPKPLPVLVWNCVDGFQDGGPDDLQDPIEALGWICREGPNGFYVFKDLGSLLDDRRVLRRLRDTAMAVRNGGRFLFLLTPGLEVPEALKPVSYVVVSLFPEESEIRALITERMGKRTADPALTDRLVTALKGMSLTEAEHLLRRLLPLHETLGEQFLKDVLLEKEQITRKEGILEFVPTEEGLADIGGLDQLKTWVQERVDLFTAEARRNNLPIPKGVLMMGMSGCGKSLAVKVIAQVWKLPLFRLDMNLVFAGTHGSPEWIFHRALQAVESVAPAVLWIDEIEMGIAGYHEGESGSLTRIFSTFLTWMQEHRAEVFVAATANRINLLPAEIIRKGRFDQVFFVDLPNDEERKEILSIHMRRQGIDPAAFDLVLLSSATRGWNGAEIEQAVISARISTVAQKKPLTQNDLLVAFGKVIPLSRTMEEQLKAIRSWARTRALPATTPERPEM